MILQTWKMLLNKPLGKPIFNQILRWYVPYTGSINPLVDELRPGYAKVRLNDRRRVRNHLKSIHAVALMNLGEAASGLALVAGIPPFARAILVGYSIEYLKKARGTLTATAECIPPHIEKGSSRQEFEVEAKIVNEANEVVSKVKARWLVDGGSGK